MHLLQLTGKPHASLINSDSVFLYWETPLEKQDYFQIRYKPETNDSRWKFCESYIKENFAEITGLMADTGYKFQVRCIYEDQEESYGPISDIIKTQKSLATELLEFCGASSTNSSPPKYISPEQENKKSRNDDARKRQLILGRLFTYIKTLSNQLKLNVWSICILTAWS